MNIYIFIVSWSRKSIYESIFFCYFIFYFAKPTENKAKTKEIRNKAKQSEVNLKSDAKDLNKTALSICFIFGLLDSKNRGHHWFTSVY